MHFHEFIRPNVGADLWLCWEILYGQLDREKEVPTNGAEQAFEHNTGIFVGFLDRKPHALETLLPVLLVPRISFHRRLLGSTGLYQISQQSHLSRPPPMYRPDGNPPSTPIILLKLIIGLCLLDGNGATGRYIRAGRGKPAPTIGCLPTKNSYTLCRPS